MEETQLTTTSGILTHQSQFHPTFSSIRQPTQPISMESESNTSKTSSPTTSISNFACSPSDMQIIESIISQNSIPKEDKVYSCVHCGRVFLTQALNLIHIKKSCPLNPNSQDRIIPSPLVPSVTGKTSSIISSDIEKDNSKAFGRGSKKNTISKRKKNSTTTTLTEEDEELAESIISSILTSSTLKKTPQRKTPSKKKTLSTTSTSNKGILKQIKSTAISPSTMFSSMSPSSTPVPLPSYDGNNTNNSTIPTISLWIPAVSDKIHLTSALLNRHSHNHHFTLQRSRIQNLNNQQLSMLLNSRNLEYPSSSQNQLTLQNYHINRSHSSISEWASHGLDHMLRTSLAGRRRLAAVAISSISPSSTTTALPPSMHNISNISTSAHLSSRSSPPPNIIISPSLNTPSTDASLVMHHHHSSKRKQKGHHQHQQQSPQHPPHGYYSNPQQQSLPSASRLAAASSLSMPEI